MTSASTHRPARQRSTNTPPAIKRATNVAEEASTRVPTEPPVPPLDGLSVDTAPVDTEPASSWRLRLARASSSPSANAPAGPDIASAACETCEAVS